MEGVGGREERVAEGRVGGGRRREREEGEVAEGGRRGWWREEKVLEGEGTWKGRG